RAAQRTSRSKHFTLEIITGFGFHNDSLEGSHSVCNSAGDRFRYYRSCAAPHAAVEQRSLAVERPGRDHVDTFQPVSTIGDTTLQPDCDCALACADLRLGTDDFRM